jgi:hypothetical protein
MAFERIFGPDFQPYDIPLIGDDLANIGRLVDIYSQPCNSEPIIWVKAFFQAIPTLIWSAFKPEIWDIDIPSRHRRGKKPKNFLFRAMDMIPDSLITIPVPRWTPFIINEALERIGWYFLIADALEDFAINWTSTAYQWNGCTLPGVAHATMRPLNDPQNYIVQSGDGGLFTHWGPVGFSPGVQVFNDFMSPNNPGKYRCSAQLKARPHPTLFPKGSVNRMTIIDKVTGQKLDGSFTGLLANAFQVAGATSQFRQTGLTSAQPAVLITGTPGWIQVDRGGSVFSLDGEVTNSLGPDP